MKRIKLQFSLIVLAVANFVATTIGFALIGNNVAIHMNINMVVDKMGSPWWGLIPSIISVLCAVGLLIETKLRGENYKNQKYLNIILYSINILFIYISWILFAFFASGLQIRDKLNVSLPILIGIPLGLLFIVMGNFMPVIKQNKTLGIKTVSTLSSEEIWTKTHRLCGILGVASGFLVIVCSILAFFTKIDWLFFSSVVLAVIMSALAPMIYARILYSKEKKNKPTN